MRVRVGVGVGVRDDIPTVETKISRMEVSAV